MKHLSVLLLVALVACGFVVGEPLKPGDPAPPFRLQGSDGKTYELAQFVGKTAVVIAWFPRAFTGG
jgi:peroxiredoxin Q/BCP